MIKFKGAIVKLEEAAARAHGRPARLHWLCTAYRHLRGVDSHLTKMHDFVKSDLPGDDHLGIWGRRGAGKTSLLTPLEQTNPYHALFDCVLYFAFGGRSSVTDVQRRIGICDLPGLQLRRAIVGGRAGPGLPHPQGPLAQKLPAAARRAGGAR